MFAVTAPPRVDLARKLYFAPPGSVPHDAAVLPAPGERLAFTTDAYVVRPLLFPGGDIGQLAVIGSVNDLAMAGARALHLSVAMILEEGLPLEVLRRVVTAMAAAARQCGLTIVTGDTKVVERGKAVPEVDWCKPGERCCWNNQRHRHAHT